MEEIKLIEIGGEIVPDREKKSGKFTKGNRTASKRKFKEPDVDNSNKALASLLDSAQGNSMEVLVGLLKNGAEVGLTLQQVLKLCEAIAPYQQARASKELDEDLKIKIIVKQIGD